MTFKTVLLTMTLLGVSIPTAALAVNPPAGTYQKTCAVQNYTGSVLTAACRPEDTPNFRSSQIDVRGCGAEIFNRDGGLQCFARQGWGSGRAIPRGSYIDSCKNVVVSNDQTSITAQCKDGNGNYRNTQFNTNGCRVGSTLDNNNGNLVCHR